jgi:hypothetical protein
VVGLGISAFVLMAFGFSGALRAVLGLTRGASAEAPGKSRTAMHRFGCLGR